MSAIKHVAFVLLAVLIILFFSSAYVVTEGQQALVLRLGKIIINSKGQPQVIDPGLHFKVPLIDSVTTFDVRAHHFASTPFLPLTSQQTYLSVDYYVIWRIDNLATYYTRTGGNEARLEQLLEQKVNDIVRAELGRHTSDQAISSERRLIVNKIQQQANQAVQVYGVSISGLRLEKIALPPRIMQSVFKRMASEREQFAKNARARGEKVAEGIRALADQRVVVIKAEANMQAAQLRATAQKQAGQIYNAAYTKDPSFFKFYQSLQAYRSAFNKNDALVLSPNLPFFDVLNQRNT